MKGAREYAKYFCTGQYGRLYITSGYHARGKTFHIQVLPEGEEAISNGSNNLCLNENAVEVYGIIGGNPGWTEAYGWLHQGKWQADFYELLEQKKQEKEKEMAQNEKLKKQKIEAEQKRKTALLSKY